jgi:hypothetical protein
MIWDDRRFGIGEGRRDEGENLGSNELISTRTEKERAKLRGICLLKAQKEGNPQELLTFT